MPNLVFSLVNFCTNCSDNFILLEEKLPAENSVYSITSLETEDAGSYLCTKTSTMGTVQKFEHEVEIISLPVYKVSMNIYYAINDTCSLTNGDILYVYLPKIFEVLLCGQNAKICSVNVDRPKCLTKVKVKSSPTFFKFC